MNLPGAAVVRQPWPLPVTDVSSVALCHDSVTAKCTSPEPFATTSPDSAPKVNPNSTVNSSGLIARNRSVTALTAGLSWSSDRSSDSRAASPLARPDRRQLQLAGQLPARCLDQQPPPALNRHVDH